MPRPNLPPTPASSTDIKGRDRPEMEVAFSLPPPAMSGRGRSTNIQNSPPISPIDQSISGNNLQRKRTLSGTSKSKIESANQNVDLPPPPSRARKIIQMKPKQVSDEPSTPPMSNPKPQSQKKKQPSATSAAGRKIARKTAHSIIERRRRSKMNEEFGVLKDMIPACKGVEMHKLAILQAGIEYVRYLQGCVERLQDQRGDRQEDGEIQPQFNRADSTDGEASPVYRQSSVVTAETVSSNPSPDLRPTSSSQTPQGYLHTSTTYSTSPPHLIAQTPIPTGVSPAFNAIHFSPDLRRVSTISSQQANISGKPSPNILPLPQAALPIGNVQGDGAAEANATAALMMLTNDRRGASRGGMSVKELLSG